MRDEDTYRSRRPNRLITSNNSIGLQQHKDCISLIRIEPIFIRTTL